MRFFMGVVLWFILLALCWPLAVLVLVLYPMIWLIALPFRLLGVVTEGFFVTLRAAVLLPARMLALPFRRRQAA